MGKSELNAVLRSHLAFFVQRSFKSLNPGTEYLHNWHIDAICYHLMLCFTGEIRRLIITVPPRCLKSICASVAFPAWILGQDPTRSIIAASYSADLAKILSNDCRQIMSTSWYQSAFATTIISETKNTEMFFQTTKNGGRFATSVGGTLTGVGADFIILDDLLKASDDPSETALTNANNWFSSSVITRLNDPKHGCIILIMQRLHENDTAGFLLQQGGWHQLNLPAIAESEQTIPVGEGKYIQRKPGELLHPERLPRRILSEISEQQGTYRFAAQYQQNPAPAGGGIIQSSWFEFYTEEITHKHPDEFIVQSWDTANSIKQHASYSVCTTWLVRDTNYFLIDVLRCRLEFPELEKTLVKLNDRWKADLVLIENNACSLPLINTIERRYPDLNLKNLRPVADKATRMQSETPAIAAGQVFLPQSAPWLRDFMRELILFPNGKHDDQVDSVSQFLYWGRLYGPNHPNSRLHRSRFIPLS